MNIPGMDSEFMKSKAGSLPAATTWVLGIVAVALSLAFDVVFIKFPINGYLWYLSTAISFGAAGAISGLCTKGSKMAVLVPMAVCGIVYAVLDIFLEKAMEPGEITMAGALILAGQGLGISLATGLGGAYKGYDQRQEVLSDRAIPQGA
jgi:hypothetical protein